MPSKLSYEKVKEEFSKKGCILLSKTYDTNRQKLDYICKCGHTHSVNYIFFKSKDNKCDYTLCKEYVLKNLKIIILNDIQIICILRHFKKQKD